MELIFPLWIANAKRHHVTMDTTCCLESCSFLSSKRPSNIKTMLYSQRAFWIYDTKLNIFCYAKSGSKTCFCLFLREDVILIVTLYGNLKNPAIDISGSTWYNWDYWKIIVFPIISKLLEILVVFCSVNIHSIIP